MADDAQTMGRRVSGCRRSGLRSVALAALAIGALWLPAPAQAFSFSLPAGQNIVDIDLSSNFGLTYDGTQERINITAEANVFRMSGGPAFDVTLSPGQVAFNLAIDLVPGSLVATDDGFTTQTIDALFANGVAADFTIWDMGGPPILLYGADFVAPVQFTLTNFFGIISSGIQGDYELHGPNPGDATFISKFGTGGTLSVDFSNLSETSICGFLDGPCASPFVNQSFDGMTDWNGQPNIDIIPIPEPSTALAVALGLAILAGRRQRGA